MNSILISRYITEKMTQHLTCKERQLSDCVGKTIFCNNEMNHQELLIPTFFKWRPKECNFSFKIFYVTFLGYTSANHTNSNLLKNVTFSMNRE